MMWHNLLTAFLSQSSKGVIEKIDEACPVVWNLINE